MTYAQILNFSQKYIEENPKGKELAKELARDYELNDPKTGQYSLANRLSEYERNKYVNLEENPIKVNYKGLGKLKAEQIVRTYIAEENYNISNLDKDIAKDIEEIQEHNNHTTDKG